jgi:hypothetical protein
MVSLRLGCDGQRIISMRHLHVTAIEDIKQAVRAGTGESVRFHRPDPEAPVSSLFVLGRKQDLAFEQEAGSSAAQRHHVRWWQAPGLDAAGRPLWIGNATFDIGAGLSHRTGQITHHIDADIDAERVGPMTALATAGQPPRQYRTPGGGATQDGKNAGGDRYFTHGWVAVDVLRPAARPAPDAPNPAP